MANASAGPIGCGFLSWCVRCSAGARSDGASRMAEVPRAQGIADRSLERHQRLGKVLVERPRELVAAMPRQRSHQRNPVECCVSNAHAGHPVCSSAIATVPALDMRSHGTPPSCTDRDKIKPAMRDGKYPQRARSRGPRERSRPPQDPDERLRRDRHPTHRVDLDHGLLGSAT